MVHLFTENQIMGAAEWTGYNTTGGTPTYSSYSTLQSTSAATVPYTYDAGNPMSEHHNFHLPAVLSDMQPFCSTTDYHHAAIAPGASSTQPPICSPTYGSTKSDIDFNAASSYSAYNNWSNGYNNYQYSSCAPQTQYPPHHTPTMVLYPQLYSTVNQNQIHLHLHGADKIEQYLGQDNSLTISSVPGRAGIEIGIGTSDHEVGILSANDTSIHREEGSTTADEDAVNDPASVWRPY